MVVAEGKGSSYVYLLALTDYQAAEKADASGSKGDGGSREAMSKK